MNNKSNIKMSSNRSFGLVFFVVFLILGLWPVKSGGDINILLILISLVFLFLAIIKSKFLTPLNKLWFKFGIKLGAIIAPIVMGVVFFLVVTPIGIIMKITGRDLINKKINKNIKTYWLNRKKAVGSMKRQF
tara:strand:- start:417 stop:812 length:396 start_codon:yes stop_codon:yes gene_type:complete